LGFDLTAIDRQGYDLVMESAYRVVVAGGGPTGLSAAISLADSGVAVTLIEQSDGLGGHARELGCKATDRCQACGACLAAPLVREVRQHGLIDLITSGRIVNEELVGGRHRFTVAAPAGSVSVEADSLVLAGGYSTIDLSRYRQEYGHGFAPGVATTLELESEIRLRGPAGLTGRRFAFIQCVGSRDKALGRDYCSRVCCASSLRLAQLIRTERPDSEVTVFYQDLQPSGRDFGALVASCEALGVVLVRGLPSKVRWDPVVGSTVVCVADTLAGAARELPFDRVVLAVGQWGPGRAEVWPGRCLSVDETGFACPEQPNGAFAAGTMTGPMGLAEAIAEGKLAAACVLERLGHPLAELKDAGPDADFAPPDDPRQLGLLLNLPGLEESRPPGVPEEALGTAGLPAGLTGRTVFLMDLGGPFNRAAHLRAMEAAAALGSQAAYVYRHAYTAEMGLERLYNEMRRAGVGVHPYTETPELGDGRLRFRDPLVGLPVEIAYDHLVVGEQAGPSPANREFHDRLGLPLDANGHVFPSNPHLGPVGTPRRGLFALDNGRGVLGVRGFEARARALARAAATVDVRKGSAKVDPDKCVSCLTCLRVCPHDAPEILRCQQRKKHLAYIEPLECMSCGICIALCPAKAIAFVEPEEPQAAGPAAEEEAAS